MEQEEPTVKETLEFMRELNQLMDLLRGGKPVLEDLIRVMDKQADGSDGTAWFQTLDKISDLDEDMMMACLMLAVSTICKVRMAIKDTPMQPQLLAAMGMLDEPEPATGEN